MTRPIAISLSPNTQIDDVLLALKTLFNPLKWFDKREVEKLEEEFADLFGQRYHAIAVNSGRSAQYLLLKTLGIGKGDQVAIQAFTCIAVPNSILWLGAKPIYVDIDETYNMDPDDLRKKITKKTRAIIVQHTFGVPADLDVITKIARKKKILLIEDCAHALGAKYKGKLVGTLSDAAFFSFGRDKIMSSVFGGMIFVKEKTEKEIEKEVRRLETPTLAWTLQQLLHPLAFYVILPLYNFGIGKILLVLLQKTGILSKAVYNKEKEGKRPRVFPAKMPPALAVLARNQLKKLERFNQYRKKIAKYYFNSLKNRNGQSHRSGQSHNRLVLSPNRGGEVWLRFPIQTKNAPDLIKFTKKKGILLGDWYREVIAPCPDATIVGYKWGSCPRAERLAKNVVNLPTYPTLLEKDAKMVVQVIKEWSATQ